MARYQHSPSYPDYTKMTKAQLEACKTCPCMDNIDWSEPQPLPVEHIHRIRCPWHLAYKAVM